nr:MAG TPA: endonuclease [Caudoviricetes sp.]
MEVCYVIKSIKLRIYPNKTQLKIINDTLYACHFIKNEFVAYNKNNHAKGKKYTKGYEFSKIINELKKGDNKRYTWLKGISGSAIQEAILSKENAYNDFFKKKKGYPKFKKRKRVNKESYYFINARHNYYITKNSVVLPKLKKVRITNGDQLPDESDIIFGRIVRQYNKYYVMFIYNEENDNKDIVKRDIKLGIDLGVKNYATIYDGTKFYYINHFKDLDKYKKLTERMTKLQQIVSKKAEYNYGKLLNKYLDKYHKEPNEDEKKKLRKESYNTSNIRRIYIKINKIKVKLSNIADDYIKKLVNWLTAKVKPSQINIEDLDISSMLENDQSRRLHRLVQESNFYKFRIHLTNKCKEYGIKLVLVNTDYPSTKLCSECGSIKDMKLSDRIYECDECGMSMDRDKNSAINIYNCKSKYYKEIA